MSRLISTRSASALRLGRGVLEVFEAGLHRGCDRAVVRQTEQLVDRGERVVRVLSVLAVDRARIEVQLLEPGLVRLHDRSATAPTQTAGRDRGEHRRLRLVDVRPVVVVVGFRLVVDASVVGVCASASLPGPDDDEPSLRSETATTVPIAAAPTTTTAVPTSV